MKKILLFSLLLSFCSIVFSQTQVDSIKVKTSLTLAGKRVTTIRNDTITRATDSEELITKAAARKLGGGSSFDPSTPQTITAPWWKFKNNIQIGENGSSGLFTNNTVTTIGDWANDGANITVDAGNGSIQSWGNFEVWGTVGENDYATKNALINSDGSGYFANGLINLYASGRGDFADGNIALKEDGGAFFANVKAAIDGYNGAVHFDNYNINSDGYGNLSVNELYNNNMTIYQNGQIDVAEAIDLYPSGRADFASGKSRLEADGGGHLANWAIYWDAAGNLSNDNNGAWSIGHEGAASFRSIGTSYYDGDNGYTKEFNLSTYEINGNINNNEGAINYWSLGTSGFSIGNSNDGGETWIAWGIDGTGNATLSSASVGGLITSRGISINNDDDVEVAYISNVGQIAFDNYLIYSDGEGLFTAVSFSGGSVSFDGGGFTSDGDGNISANSITIGGGQSSLDNGLISTDGAGNLAAETLSANNGANGTFTSSDSKVVTVVNGIVTSIDYFFQ